MSRVSKTGSMLYLEQQEKEKEEKSRGNCTPLVTVTLIFYLSSATLSVTSFKLQSSKYHFKHGVFQTILMFFGEFVNLLIFYFMIVQLYLLNKRLLARKI